MIYYVYLTNLAHKLVGVYNKLANML